MAKKKAFTKKETSTAYPEIGNFTREIYEKLPFRLTDAQINAMKEIRKDISIPQQMNRLVQAGKDEYWDNKYEIEAENVAKRDYSKWVKEVDHLNKKNDKVR